MSSSDVLSSSSTASHARTTSGGSTTRGNSISVTDASSLPGGGIEVISRADVARDNALLQLVRMGFTQVDTKLIVRCQHPCNRYTLDIVVNTAIEATLDCCKQSRCCISMLCCILSAVLPFMSVTFAGRGRCSNEKSIKGQQKGQ
jgi:hypothetical protein